MALAIGDTAPDFEQDSSIGPIKFHDWAGDSWVEFPGPSGGYGLQVDPPTTGPPTASDPAT